MTKNRIFSALLALVAVLTAASAKAQEVSGLEIGYCEGMVSTKGLNAFSSTTADDHVSGAIYLPASTLKLYEGCEIRQIHAGMASVLNIDELQVWIRESLDGENLAQATITKQTTPKLAKSWNTVDLETPYIIPEGCEGLYIGLTFHQTSVSVGLSVLTSDLFPSHENGLFVKLGDNAEWTDRHDEGTLAIEALVFGDNLPKFNLMVRDFTLDPTYVIDKGVLNGSVTVRNNAAATITGFDIVCNIEGIDATYTYPVECNLAYKAEGTFEFTFNPAEITTDDPDMRNVTLTIANLKEGDDQDTSDNSVTTSLEIVKHDFARNVLVEEFTTENCPNCPRVASMMHEMLATDDFDERVNVICHHSAYYTDWLTIPADNDYMWLFNMGGSTFAPALVIDRFTSEYTGNREPQSPIMLPTSQSELNNTIKRRMKDVAYVCVNLDVELADGSINVKATGERIKDFTKNPARIVVALVEDNIKARSQASGGSDFVHQHVNRAYNSTWGDVIEWNGNEFEYECSFSLDNRYKKEDLVVVAYIWDYDPNDVQGCEVANSNRVRYAQMKDNTGSGIEGIEADEAAVEYYSIDGIRLNGLQNGLNIVRRADGSVVKVMKSK